MKTVDTLLPQGASAGLATAYYLLARLSHQCDEKSKEQIYLTRSLKENKKAFCKNPHEGVVMNLVSLAQLKISQHNDALPSDQAKLIESILSLLQEAETMCNKIEEMANPDRLFSSVYQCKGRFEYEINQDLTKAGDYFIKSFKAAERFYGRTSIKLHGLLSLVCRVDLETCSEDDASFDYFARLVLISGNCFGKCSCEYNTALSYIVQKVKTMRRDSLYL